MNNTPWARQQQFLHWTAPLPWALLGLGVVLSGVLAATGSWKLFLAATGGVLVSTVVLFRPHWGLYLVAATIPLDAAGRLGNILANINLSLGKICVLVTLVAWVIQLALRRTRFVWAREASWLCVYFAVCLVSLVDSHEFKLGYQAAMRLAMSIVFYVLLFNMVRTRAVFLRTLAIFTLVSLMTFAFGVAQRYLPSFSFNSRVSWSQEGAQTFGVEQHDLDAGRSGTVARSSGVTYHAIILAINTDLVLAIVIGALFLSRHGPWRLALWVGVGICGAANIAAYSRTGLLLLFVVIALLIFRGFLRISPLRLGLAVAVLLVGVFLAPQSWRDRIFSFQSYTTRGSESLRQRVKLVSAGLRIVRDHPVNGLGMETTYRIFDYFDYEDKEAVVTVHNGYLQVALEMGLPGIATILIFLGLTGWGYWSASRKFHDSDDIEMAVFSECLLISFVVFLFAGMTVDFMRIGFKNVWLLMALAPALQRLADNASADADSDRADAPRSSYVDARA